MHHVKICEKNDDIHKSHLIASHSIFDIIKKENTTAICRFFYFSLYFWFRFSI